MGMKIKGLDGLNKVLKDIKKETEKLNGTHVSFDELFDTSFMTKYTNFSSFDDLLKEGNFVVNCKEDFEAIPSDEFDIHIRNSTKFNSWKEMQLEATKIHVTKKLGF